MTAPARLRALMAGGMAAAPGCCDAFTARLIARAGFPAVYLGGNALGLSLAEGQPLVTLTETAQYASRIALAVEAPLIVDAGAGFGGTAHVHRTVRELEHAGVAALHIDDQPYPKSPGYHRGAGGLAGAEEAAGRYAVAREARRDPDLMIIARTDALRVTGALEEAISRGAAYLEAGADALLILDLEVEQVAAVRASLPQAELVWLGGVPKPAPALKELEAAGFALALYPFNTIAAISEAVSALWRTVAETGSPHQDEAFLVRHRRELSEIAGLPLYWEIEDRLGNKER